MDVVITKHTTCPKINILSAWLKHELPLQQEQYVSRHVEICKKCKSWAILSKMMWTLEQSKNEDDFLSTKNDCINEVTLLAFIKGQSSRQDRRKIINHLADCRHCRELSTQLYRENQALLAVKEKSIVNFISDKLNVYQGFILGHIITSKVCVSGKLQISCI